MPIPSSITDLSITPSANSPAGSESPTEGDNYIRALSAIVRQTYGEFTANVAALASTSTAAPGASLVGIYDPSDYFATDTSQAAIAELGASRKRMVNVADYPWLADMTGATDSTWAVHLADVYAESIGAQIYVPAGTLTASIVARRDDFGLIGAGNTLTTIKTPATTFSISSVSRAGTKIVTVVLAGGSSVTTDKLWVDASVKLSGVTDSSFNFGYIVTAIDSSTQFKCYAEDGSAVVATSSGGVVSYANAVEVGEMQMANAATAYTGVTLRGFTADGNKSNRAAVGSDLTDWGVAITACSELDVDVWATNCHNGGVGAFINSNKGKIVSYTSACGNVTYSPCGFDLNSSKYLTIDAVDVGSYDGARILDNCWGINARISSYNPTRYGFIHQNQTSPSTNVCHTNNLDIAVYTSGNHGVILGEGLTNSNFRITTHTSGAIGVYLTNAATNARQVTGCIINATTRNSQNAGLQCYGNYNSITHRSYMDGRAGAAGSYFGLDMYGDGNTIDSFVFDSGTAQVRGQAIRSGADGNVFIRMASTGTVSTYSDSGASTSFPVITLFGSETWDPGSLAVGAGSISTGTTITGAALGDTVVASWPSNLQGFTLNGYVSAANTVRAVLFNAAAGGPIDFGSSVIQYRVIKQIS